MANQLIITHSGKTYKYNFFKINQHPSSIVQYYVPTKIDELVPLFSFLELPTEPKVIPCTINGIDGTIEISLIRYANFYQAELKYNSYSLIVNEPDSTYNNYASIAGTCLGYNYYDKNYVRYLGGQAFTPQDDGSRTYIKNSYYEDLTHGTKILDYHKLKANVLYKANLNTEDNVNFYTAAVERINSAFFDNLGIKQPSYPDQDPDDDEPDGQPEPDPGIPGDGDTSSDPIPDPPPQPTFDVTSTGFVVIYNPSVTEIRELAYFMWSGEFVDLIKKMFSAPFDAIISLKMLFVPVPESTRQKVWLGNVETTVTMAKVNKQFTDIDLGSIQITEFFGSFADYAPFTRIQIYLPFIGYKDLNTDEVMNSTLHLRYRVDVYSGTCVAYLTVTKNIKSTPLNSILYQFDGSCAMEIPFTSNDNSRYVSALLGAATSSALSLSQSSGFTSQQPSIGDFDTKATDQSFKVGSLAPVVNGLMDVMSAKPNTQRSGSLVGASSAMAIKTPYIIITRPIQAMPKNYQHFIGIPLNLTYKLNQVTGFTTTAEVYPSSTNATVDEINQIVQILKSGVIL